MMLNILWLIDYRMEFYTYYEELVAFGKWLHEMRQRVELAIGSFEDFLAINEAKFRREIEDGVLTSDRLRECMWLAAYAQVEHSFHRVINVSPEELSQKLRENIPSPFIHYWKSKEQKQFL